ncbi:MAG TPA: zinc ribbon domain-containing protein [Candidatus Omnitrophota bacterium]|nr:zinc ribbon domain-containing protein [Candidatus Omnitrophota bacterium]
MPTYEYQCKKCGHKFEKFQSMTESPVKECPQCKGDVERMISTGAGVIFKGKGFYQTDYKPSCGKDKSPEKPSCGAKGCCDSCSG